MSKKIVNSHSNPLRPFRTKAEFLAVSPGATCEELKYSPDLSAFILKLANGTTFVVAGNEESAWDRGVDMLEKGCIASQTKAANCDVTAAGL
jgi:hypothetical protein